MTPKKQAAPSDEEQAAQAEQTDAGTAAEQEIARVAALSDQQVLNATSYGKFGPAIVGDHLHKRSQQIMKGTFGGKFGPAITDPDYEQKRSQALMRTRDDRINAERRLATLARVGEQSQTGLDTVEIGHEPNADPDLNDYDADDLDDARNPWSTVTLSGAKVLAQQNGVSYPPRIKRTELIGNLRKAGVTPPAIDDAGDGVDEPGDD